MSGEAIGMMDKAYFVGKVAILQWFNELLCLQLAKIEQCATGSVYCAVMDCLYPGTFQFSKVKWNAKHEYEFVENYKILQQSFDRNGIKRYIEVNKLTKAKYQDNLEFCQWLKAYFEKNYNGEPYDAIGRRKGQELFYIAGGGKVAPPSGAGQPKPGAPTGGAPRAAPSMSSNSNVGNTGPRQMPRASGGSAATVQLENQIQELKLQNDTLDKERDFYFTKLRDIEMLLQARNIESSDNVTAQDILKILYASEEEKVTVGAEGTLTIVSPSGTVESKGEMPMQ